MIKFTQNTIERKNAVKSFLTSVSNSIPKTRLYDGYKKWLRQFNATENNLEIRFKNPEDATAFKLRFGGRQ